MQCLRQQITSATTLQLLCDGFRPRFRPSFPCFTSTTITSPQSRHPFSANAIFRQAEDVASSESSKELAQQKRKPKRSPAGKNSLRRVAVEAQRSRENKGNDHVNATDAAGNHRVTALSVAEEFDMEAVLSILRAHGFQIDPDSTGFEPDQVIHTRGFNDRDIFVFPSGSLVTWALPSDVASDLATKTLLPAAIKSHVDRMEMEDLEYEEDLNRDHSAMKGDVIILGTEKDSQKASGMSDRVDTTYAKIAFSSGLARSTKLAILETMLRRYFESTRTIPTLLAQGSSLPIDSQFILKKTGELLELRAQLNHYSELTDSLPDLFWDSRHDLGLEAYFDQVGRILDVGVRIKTLNQKMDYAQEIASILRQYHSERHSIKLEWIIIILIAVEVGFELRRILKEWYAQWQEENKV